MVNSAANFTVNPHDLHDSSPYAILFIFASCTIGGEFCSFVDVEILKYSISRSHDPLL